MASREFVFYITPTNDQPRYLRIKDRRVFEGQTQLEIFNAAYAFAESGGYEFSDAEAAPWLADWYGLTLVE